MVLRELHAAESRPRFCLREKAKSTLGGLDGAVSMPDLKTIFEPAATLFQECEAKTYK